MGAGRYAVWAGVAALAASFTPSSPHVNAASGSVTQPTAVALSDCYSPDNGNPVLAAFMVTPPSVDARSGPASVIFKATPQDTGGPGPSSGVTAGHISIGRTPSASFGSWRMRWNRNGELVLRLDFSPRDLSALWYVSVGLRDGAGNSTEYTARDLMAAGLPATFTSLTAAPLDQQRPRLTSLRLSTTVLDVSAHRTGVGLRVHARDDNGVAWMEAWLYGEDNLFTTRIAKLRLREGNARRGLWRGRIIVPRLAGDETAHLIIEMWDYHGRHRKYLPKRLATMDQPHEIDLRGFVNTERPELRTPAIRPTSVDLRDSSKKVTLRVHITDTRPGVEDVIGDLSGSATGLNHQGYNLDFKLVRGDRRDGVWKATATLNRCRAEAGRWSAYVIAFDYALPGRSKSTRAITVLNDDIGPPMATVRDPVPAAGPLTLRFDEDVVGISAENIKVQQGRNVEERPGDGPPSIAGSWTCRTAGGTPVDCVVGPVRTASFTPDAPFLADAQHAVILNPEHHLGLTDLAGNPSIPLFNREVMFFNDLGFTPQ